MPYLDHYQRKSQICLRYLWCRASSLCNESVMELNPSTAPSCPFEVPSDVRECVASWYGPSGDSWLHGLPTLASSLVAMWGLKLDGTSFAGGTQALVLPVCMADGTRAVLKVSYPDPDNLLEAEALSRIDGYGAVRVFRRLDASNAILLERALPGTPLSRLHNIETMLTVQGSVLRRAARPLHGKHPFTPSSALAREWGAWVVEHVPTACGTVPQDVGAPVEAFLRAMGTSAPSDTLVNSDGHAGNILSCAREGWLLADPKPVAGCAEFEAGCMFAPFAFGSEDHIPEFAGHAGELSRLFAMSCAARGACPAIAGHWAAAKAVQNYLWAVSVGSRAVPRMSALLGPYIEAVLG